MRFVGVRKRIHIARKEQHFDPEPCLRKSPGVWGQSHRSFEQRKDVAVTSFKLTSASWHFKSVRAKSDVIVAYNLLDHADNADFVRLCVTRE